MEVALRGALQPPCPAVVRNEVGQDGAPVPGVGGLESFVQDAALAGTDARGCQVLPQEFPALPARGPRDLPRLQPCGDGFREQGPQALTLAISASNKALEALVGGPGREQSKAGFPELPGHLNSQIPGQSPVHTVKAEVRRALQIAGTRQVSPHPHRGLGLVPPRDPHQLGCR